MEHNCTSGVTAIVRSMSGPYVSRFCAIIPSKAKDKARYIIAGPSDIGHCRAYKLWLHWPDGEDHRAVKRRTGTRKSTPYEFQKKEHANYIFHQENPMERNIGDCVVRALSAVLGVSWHDTVDMLSIKHYGSIPFFIHADGDLQFIAIAVGRITAYSVGHVHLNTADFDGEVAS